MSVNVSVLYNRPVILQDFSGFVYRSPFASILYESREAATKETQAF